MGRKKKEESWTIGNIGCLTLIILVGIIAFIQSYGQEILDFLIGLSFILIIIGILYVTNHFIGKENNKSLLKREDHEYQFKLRDFENRKNLLLQSPDYVFIQQFSQKYKSNASDEDIDKLQILLQNKQRSFSPDELREILIYEDAHQEAQNIRTKILASNPDNLDSFLRSYIEVCGSNYDKVNVLAELLHSSKIYLNPDIYTLHQELSRVSKQIELELFERQLLGEDNLLTMKDIDSLDGYEFERFLSDLYTKMGYQVEPTKLSGDQGADVVVIKFGEKTVIQAKRYGRKVSNKAVQEILAAVSLYKAHKGVVITNNYFTKSAVELADANRIQLIDRDGLLKLIENNWF